MTAEMPPAMILCGGYGTRLRDVTELLPKPLVPIGGQPIVWHIMKSYAAYGVRRFILCLGYKKEEFIDYFLNYRARRGDITIRPGGVPEFITKPSEAESDWQITLADTGLDTMTGGRIRLASRYLAPGDRDFFMTYGDGVSDVDIAGLLAFHRRSGRALTITAVHPEGRFGELDFDGDRVARFCEKPPRSPGYVNGGFMVLRREAIDRFIPEKDCFFEQSPILDAVAAGEVAAFRHEGFWQCMDTPREHKMLNDLWMSGSAPWRRAWGDGDALR